MREWRNWSGAVRFSPARLEHPESIDALVQLIRESAAAGRHVRVAGTGHSFTPLCETDDTLVTLDKLTGLVHGEKRPNELTVLGGTKLWRVNELVEEEGLAMENLGDINKQALAGAISTGTHGTGAQFGVLATQASALTLVSASGEAIECSERDDPDLFKAAQVSLGALGVMVKVRLRLVPTFRLKYERKKVRFDECAEHIESLRSENRHFEFYYFPHTRTVQLKLLNPTDEPASNRRLLKWFNDVLLENVSFGSLSVLCRALPVLCPAVSRFASIFVSQGREVNVSHKVLSTTRMVRFNEMEYAVPAEHGLDALREIMEWIERERIRVHFPIEFRFVKGDDIWLSPCYGRDSACISIHMYRGMEYERYFQGAEQIFRRYDGRPHWGKMHNLTARDLAPLYPKWDAFHAIRARLDPTGVFMNNYLRELFGH